MAKAPKKEFPENPWSANTHEPSAQDGYLHAGFEFPDPTPMAPPVGYKKPVHMHELIRDMVRGERLRQEAEAMGAESFEESEDFDVGDDYDPTSPWENDHDPSINELRQAVAASKPPSDAPTQPPGNAPANPPSDGPNASTPSAPAPAGDAKPS